MLRKILFVALLEMMTMAVFAQTGTISGVITDAKTAEAVIGANVVIQGTTVGAATDIEGKFTIKNIKPGTYTLNITYITYKPGTIQNVVVEADKNTEIQGQLTEDTQELDEIIVTGQADKTSEAVLLAARKNSVLIVQNIGAQELSRKGVSNAEAAVTQVTGVSKQQGVRNVFVRGLGDRYNSTSLNGLPLPSENPEYKNITLDFFSSDIINSIDVNKTFGPTLSGDVAGANINIVSKNLFDDRELSISVSGGMNSQTAGTTFYKTDGSNFFGFADKNIPITNLNVYSFKHSYQPVLANSPLANTGFSISGGKRFYIGNHSLKTFFVGNISNDYQYKEGVERQVYPNANAKQDFDYKKYETGASQIVMGNLKYELNSEDHIQYNGMFIHDNDQYVSNYTGFSTNGNDDISDPNAHKALVRRQQQNDNTLFVNQLLSEFSLSDKLKLKPAASFNIAKGSEPDRKSNFFVFDGEDYRINTNSSGMTHRFYSSLTEKDLTASATMEYAFSAANPANKIEAGYSYRNTNRDFEATQFSMDFKTANVVNPENVDELISQESIDNDLFDMETKRGTSLRPETYSVQRSLHSVFANAFIELNEKMTLNVGVREEIINQDLTFDTSIQPVNPNNPKKNNVIRKNQYFLPSLNAKYSLTENDFVRLAASKTYTYPQFKEVAPFLYENINNSSFGNQGLLPAENINTDLRFEHYFSNSEYISVTGFYKHITNAINKTMVSSAANEVSYVNTGNASVAGIEVEARKSITSFLDAGVNVSYLYSKQELKDVGTDNLVVQFNDKTSALEGASPLLVNADVTYKKEFTNNRKLMVTVNYNYYSDRIYALGAPQENNHVYERGTSRLDAITKFDLNQHFTIGLTLRNLLNPAFVQTKEVQSGEDAIISSYKKGVSSSFSLSYKL